MLGGNREDLRDILTILEPEGCPVTSMIKKGPAPKATLIEVVADTLRDVRTQGTPEGKDITTFNNKAVDRRRFGNYIHVWEDSYAVTDIEQQVQIAGTDDLYAEAKAKCIRELKRDIEATLCADQEMQQGSGSDEWRTRGLFKWIQSTAQAVNPVPTEFLTPAGNIVTPAIADLTEDVFNNVLQSLFSVYGDRKRYDVVAGIDVIEQVDNYSRVQPSAINQRYYVTDSAEKRQIILSVKIFDSSFGIATLIPTMFNEVTAGVGDGKTAYFLNMELLELQFLETLHSVDLPDYGGGPRGYCKAVGSLCVKNPRGLGKIAAT